jgi:hypothetical protein
MKLAWFFTVFNVMVVIAAVAYRDWPRRLALSIPAYPSPGIQNGRVTAPFPANTLLAEVGNFQDELSAYLWFDYLRARPSVDSSKVFLTVSESGKIPEYQIYLLLPNDAIAAIAYLSDLEHKGYITQFDFVFCTLEKVQYARKETSIFLAAYKKPVNQRLEQLTADQLLPPVARFVQFKSKTDGRVRLASAIRPESLDDDQATQMAADIIAVAKFYDLPLDAFLGIGAMENNYLNVRGDLKNTVWKRRAAKDDIILERRHHRVLVSDYSIGPWQVTRETLRYAHRLYLKDKRDYSQLPERLRPPDKLVLDLTDSHVLTTYAGLLLRDLLDRFDGDVNQAVGAYNGGARRPNPQYAAGVNLVATYARNVLERVKIANEYVPAPDETSIAQGSSASSTPSDGLPDQNENTDRLATASESPAADAAEPW